MGGALKNVIGIAQLGNAPGERIMCAKGSNVKSPEDWKGKAVASAEPSAKAFDDRLASSANSSRQAYGLLAHHEEI